MKLPDKQGRWLVKYTECIQSPNEVIGQVGVWADAEMEFDVYPLDPVGGRLCVWGKDIGVFLDYTNIWDSDEWLGHIPVESLPFDGCGPCSYQFLE